MSQSLTYPAITGHVWNAKQKIADALGLNFSEFSIAVIGTDTFIGLPRKLTDTELSTLNTIMANDPCSVPKAKGTAFRVKDLWSMRKWFEKEVGIPFVFYFESEADGLAPCHIHLHFERTLTLEEKERVRKVYCSMID